MLMDEDGRTMRGLNATLPKAVTTKSLEEKDEKILLVAMAHSDDLESFMASAARMLDAGGRLVVMDDFAESEAPPSRWLATYRAHWLVPGVRPVAEVKRIAQRHGLRLVGNRDLTPWIRLGRPRDRLLRWTRPLWA